MNPERETKTHDVDSLDVALLCLQWLTQAPRWQEQRSVTPPLSPFLWFAGRNAPDQLGSSGQTSTGPEAVSGGGSWKAISSGLYFNCGIQNDGTLYCWGEYLSSHFDLKFLCLHLSYAVAPLTMCKGN
jgi:hypothetical protein